MKITKNCIINVYVTITFSISLIFFGLFICEVGFDCPNSIGLFFMFSLIFSATRLFNTEKINLNDNKYDLIYGLFYEFIFEIVFIIWGLVEMSNECMNLFPTQRIYGYIIIAIHTIMCIMYLLRYRDYYLICKQKKNSNTENNLLDDIEMDEWINL
tara:strand:+ start:1917 stop:2384 length:468 start_codon:yes stop_codon:yes gene_type:complete